MSFFYVRNLLGFSLSVPTSSALPHRKALCPPLMASPDSSPAPGCQGCASGPTAAPHVLRCAACPALPERRQPRNLRDPALGLPAPLGCGHLPKLDSGGCCFRMFQGESEKHRRRRASVGKWDSVASPRPPEAETHCRQLLSSSSSSSSCVRIRETTP